MIGWMDLVRFLKWPHYRMVISTNPHRITVRILDELKRSAMWQKRFGLYAVDVHSKTEATTVAAPWGRNSPFPKVKGCLQYVTRPGRMSEYQHAMGVASALRGPGNFTTLLPALASKMLGEVPERELRDCGMPPTAKRHIGRVLPALAQYGL